MPLAPMTPEFEAAKREVEVAREELAAALRLLELADPTNHAKYALVARDATSRLDMSPDGSGLRRAAARMRTVAASIRNATKEVK